MQSKTEKKYWFVYAASKKVAIKEKKKLFPDMEGHKEFPQLANSYLALFSCFFAFFSLNLNFSFKLQKSFWNTKFSPFFFILVNENVREFFYSHMLPNLVLYLHVLTSPVWYIQKKEKFLESTLILLLPLTRLEAFVSVQTCLQFMLSIFWCKESF